MGQIGRVALKAFFETGDIPTEAQFIDLIDSLLNITDDDSDDITESSTKEFLDNSAAQEIDGTKEFNGLTHSNNSASAIKGSTATPNFNVADGSGQRQQMTLNANVTSFTITGDVGSAKMEVFLINDGTAGRTVAGPTGWVPDASSETHTTAANAINLYQFYTLPNHGTKYFNIHIVKA